MLTANHIWAQVGPQTVMVPLRCRVCRSGCYATDVLSAAVCLKSICALQTAVKLFDAFQ